MNFYIIFGAAQQVPLTPRELGLVVVDLVMRNRVENNHVYQSRKHGYFRNQECDALLYGIDKLVKKEIAVPTLDSLLHYVGDRLGPRKHRESPITEIRHMYDVVKFIAQKSGSIPANRISIPAEFIGSRMPGLSREKPETFEEYQRIKETPKAEYARILQKMTADLRSEFRTSLVYED